ncbi:MAG: DsbA family protein [Phenylobacterium sp.]|uniref:DsbA family protein n=1 Tax=Phenylobacterium sp. TaxID=1871053 RepID=UPI00391CE958
MASLAGRRPRLTLAAAVLAAVAVSAGLQSRPPKAAKLTLTPVVARVLEDGGSPRIGARDPEVVVVVFTDYRCAICRRTDPALERLIATDPGVQVIYKDWPILGAASEDAAKVALAARSQGKYLQVHRALMTAKGPLDADGLRRAVASAGADWERLQADRAAQAQAIEAQLAGHASQAWSLGFRGTPAYLVGPYRVEGGLDDRDLSRLVAEARKSGPPR